MKSKHSERTTRRGLGLESLENRSLLAGDISVALNAGVLKIQGDDAANGVLIRQIVEPSTTVGQPPVVKWAVGGTETGGAATTVNGAAERFVTNGPVRNVVIELGKGDDNLLVANPKPTDPAAPPPKPVLLPGNPVIALGEGNDTMVGNIANGGFLKIIMGAGDDKVALGGAQLNSVKIDGDVPPPPPPPPSTDGNTAAGKEAPVGGADRLSIENSFVKGPMAIEMGAGDDGVSITGRTGFEGPLGIRLGAGNDGLKIGNVPAADATTPPPAIKLGKGLVVAGGLGNDKVGLHGIVAVGKVGIETHEGADEVVLAAVSATDGIFAALGAGNDKLSVGKSRSPKAGFNGGEGDGDVINNAGDNQFGTLLVTNFENPAPAAT